MELLPLWPLLRLLKFASALAYTAGLGLALSPVPLPLRKRVVHSFASPALLSTWVAGYFLTLFQGTPLTEAWILGGFLASTACQLLLVHTTRSERVTGGQIRWILGLLLLTLLCMVFRPTWGRMLG